MMKTIIASITKALHAAGLTGELQFATPPNPEMGDIAIPCFPFAKAWGTSPVEIAKTIVERLHNSSDLDAIDRAVAAGPYVNLFLRPSALLDALFAEQQDQTFTKQNLGKEQRVLVEFACPNPMKAFHIGHLRNTISGESVARILEHTGYDVIRTNYQGDVGRHIAMTLWGIYQHMDEFVAAKDLSVKQRVEFLGKVYAFAATKFKEEESVQPEILAFNAKVYEGDEEVKAVYDLARSWSLEYFETIYTRLDARFDHYYFESQTFENGTARVREALKKGIFTESDGAVIFEGSKYEGLHDRVFINSKGFPTYEGKDIGLAELHLKNHNPDAIYHVVGKDQTDYFKVVFQAIGEVFPELKGKEHHIIGGYVQLKGDQKMSSRLGNVVTGDQLIDVVEDGVREIMNERGATLDEETLKAIADSAYKYAMLKVGISDDISFDFESSISISGDSGPYLLYVIARINRLLAEQDIAGYTDIVAHMPEQLEQQERLLVVELAGCRAAVAKASEQQDPGAVAKYAYQLAQKFHQFYGACDMLRADEQTKQFRLQLSLLTKDVLTEVLDLLAITPVEEI